MASTAKKSAASGVRRRGEKPAELGNDPLELARLDREATLIATLSELGGASFAEESIKHEGVELVVPSGMSYLQAAQTLVDHVERQEEPTEFTKTFPYRPLDGAWCTWRALKDAFGAVGHDSRTVETMFGPMKTKPEVITVKTGPHTEEQVPWGNFTVPFLPGVELSLGMVMSPTYGPIFTIKATGPRKYQHAMQGIFKLVEERLQTDSIYKGKAIDGQNEPQFIDLSGVDPRRVIYTQEVWRQLDANINSPLRFSREHRALKLPLKRAILLYGEYGTGKTLAAYLTGQVAIKNGWTFIMARPGQDNLIQVMQTARLYQPAVVFYEDMDVIASADSTQDDTTRMLEIFDGIPAKGTEIMVVLTTNHADRIHKGMLRAGRLDAVIHIETLDRPGIEDLVKSIIPDSMLDPDTDYDIVYDSMKHLLPAFAKEAIDRTVRYSLPRVEGDTDAITLTTQDFVDAASGLNAQLTLMNDAEETKQPDVLGSVIDRHMVGAVRKVIRPEMMIESE